MKCLLSQYSHSKTIQKFDSRKDWNSYKQALEIFRDLGTAEKYPELASQLYFGLYLLIADPNLFDRLPELKELDRLHSEVFMQIGLLGIKKFHSSSLRFP